MKQANDAVLILSASQLGSLLEAKLLDAIDHHGLRTGQVLIPPPTPLLLNTDKLPMLDPEGQEFLELVLLLGAPNAVIHAPYHPAAQHLTSTLGPDFPIGSYLATEFLRDAVHGIGPYSESE